MQPIFVPLLNCPQFMTVDPLPWLFFSFRLIVHSARSCSCTANKSFFPVGPIVLLLSTFYWFYNLILKKNHSSPIYKLLGYLPPSIKTGKKSDMTWVFCYLKGIKLLNQCLNTILNVDFFSSMCYQEFH